MILLCDSRVSRLLPHSHGVETSLLISTRTQPVSAGAAGVTVSIASCETCVSDDDSGG